VSGVGEWKGDEGNGGEEKGDGENGEDDAADDANDAQERPAPLGGSKRLFKSAYAAVHGAEPPYTNWTPTFLGTLDYVFVSEQWRCERASIVPEAALIPTRTSSGGSDIDVGAEVTDKVSALSVSADAARNTHPDAAEYLEAAEIEDAAAKVAVAFQHPVPGPFPSSCWPSDHTMLFVSLVLG
jgi:hypothetical protein